jgi:predicted nucleic acid-binding Zn ribbon protein
MQKISDPPPPKCPECGGSNITKILSRTAFALKGTGWYVTDFRDGGKKPAPKDDLAKDGAAAEKKTEAAPATTPASTPTATETKSPAAATPAAKTKDS